MSSQVPTLSTRLLCAALPLAGLYRIERQRLGDNRGFFSRIFCAQELAAVGWPGPVAQINHSYTARRGTIRGMHFQHPPHAEAKLVSCLRGAVWDVAVDLRAGSPTLLRWHAQELSVDNGAALLIPAGFAHGFQTLCDDVELLYCHSVPYQASAEAGLDAFDPRLAIAWPLPMTERSARDSAHPAIAPDFQGLLL
ncbi:MAG: dTDP-4-dehydrorhamnose 3,5-epimerase [Rhodoferax sp.]